MRLDTGVECWNSTRGHDYGPRLPAPYTYYKTWACRWCGHNIDAEHPAILEHIEWLREKAAEETGPHTKWRDLLALTLMD